MNCQTFENHAKGNEKLWQAVIDSAIAEWSRGTLGHKMNAEFFLFQDEEDFPFVCRAAGLNPDSVRESLWSIRAHSVYQANAKIA